MTFFKRAAKQTVLQGIFAAALYQLFNLLESNGPESKDLGNLLFKKFIYDLAIPTLATFGYEFKRRFTSESDAHLAAINLLGSTLTAYSVPFISRDISIPLTLYAFALYYRYLAKTDGFFPEAPDEEVRQRPRTR